MKLNKKLGVLYGSVCLQILFSNGIYANNSNETQSAQSDQDYSGAVKENDFFQYGRSAYFHNNGAVYFRGELIPNADPKSFVPLGKKFAYFAKDQKMAYFLGKPIIGADLESFSIISRVHSKDKNHVYYQEKIIDQADPNTLISLDGQEPRDKQLNYLLDANAVYYAGKKIPDSDPASFKIISSSYEKDKHHVYSKGVILSHLDPATFEELSYYSKDKSHAYFKEKLILNADSASFQELGYGENEVQRESSHYAKDKNRVYRNDNALPDVDQASFELLRHGEANSVYAKDKNHVYFDGTPMPQADIASFELMTTEYAKDKNWVYLNGEPQGYLNPKTFKDFECGYQSDGRNIYHSNYASVKNMYEDSEKMAQFDAASFEVLFCVYNGYDLVEYAKDKNGIYFNRSPILYADLETFKMVNPSDRACNYGKDKYRVYEDGRVVTTNVDPESFRCLPDNEAYSYSDQAQYTIDKNHVYYLNQPIYGADHETFEILDMDFSADHKNAYYKTQRIEGADVNTFKPLSYPHMTTSHSIKPPEYSKDKTSVYYKTMRIIGSDPENFSLLVDPHIGKHKYVKDKNHVYLDGQIVAQADPKTFRFMSETYSAYTKDDKNIYFADQIVKEADRATFGLVSSRERADSAYYKDKTHVYHDGKILADANVEQFAVLDDSYCNGSDCYYTDQSHIYYKGERVTEMDAPTMVVFNPNYAKDKHHVYFREYPSAPFIVLKGLDPNGFQVPKVSRF